MPLKAVIGDGVASFRDSADRGPAFLPAISDTYCAALEVGSINYHLCTQTEQAAILAQFRALITALTYPIQILVRVLPLDLEPYLHALARHAAQSYAATTKEAVPNGALDIWPYDGTDWQAQGDEVSRPRAGRRARTRRSVPFVAVTESTAGLLVRLAHEHMEFVRSLAVQRGLLERHFYVIIPASDVDSFDTLPASHLLASLQVLGQRLTGRRRGRALSLAYRRQVLARQQLDLRSQELSRQLTGMRLTVRRLHGDELVELVYSCLTPERARWLPLAARHCAADLPPMPAPGSLAAASTQSAPRAGPPPRARSGAP